MKVKKLIDALNHYPSDADAVIVIPSNAVPKESGDLPNIVAYDINQVFISRCSNGFCEIGITI